MVMCLLVVTPMFLVACTDQPLPMNVLIVTFDTTRADQIGTYGNPAKATPNIDRLGASGTVFEIARTAVPITLPSHSTIMTGKYPPGHGVRDNGLFVLDDQSNVTLAEILRTHGYATGAAIASFPLVAQFGLNQGFDYYNDHVTAAFEDISGTRKPKGASMFFDERPAESVNAALIPWLRDHHQQPFFAFAHYFDPHHPHVAPAAFRSRFPTSGYLAEIAYADAAFGQLLEELEQLGVLDRTLVIVTSDHGEGIGEHNESTHSLLNYDSTLHVPMVMRIPGQEPGRVQRAVGTVDIVPTVLDALGLPEPSELAGISLLPLVEHGAVPAWFPPAEYYAETLSPRVSHGWGELRTLITDQYKYVHGPRSELFDWRADPGELDNLLSSSPDTANSLWQRLSDWVASLASSRPSQAVAASADTLARLQALGYVQGSGDTGQIVEVLRDDGIAPQDRVHHVNDLSAAKGALAARRPLEAQSALDRLLEEDPNNEAYLRLAANAARQLGQPTLAAAFLQAIIDQSGIDGAGVDTVLALADILMSNGKEHEASELIQASQELNTSAAGQYKLAMAHKAMGQSQQAMASFESVLALNPDDYLACNELAVLLDQAGNSERAEALFEHALSIQPYFAKLHYNYGVFAMVHGDQASAVERFDRALELKADYVSAHHARGVLAVQQGDVERASVALDWLLRHAPDAQQTQQLKAEIKENS